MPQSGHLSITCPWSKDVLFNVVRGHWPGGTYGVLCHETRMLTGYSPGIFHSEAISEAGMDWKGLPGPLELFVPLIGGDDEEYFRTPYTTAGSRVPHLATITGLHVARRAERHEGDSAVWTTRPLDDLGLDGHWVAAIRRNSDLATAEHLLAGPVREICVPRYGARPLDCELDPPEWLAAVREQPRKQATSWPIGALVNRVVAIADERGLAVEDPLSFHAAFPGLNVPGQAFGVLRGTLPGTSLSGRLVSLAERRMWLPDGLREHLTDPGGQVGADAVVLAVDPATASTAPEGELEGDVRVAVADGVLTAWRKRDRWQADGEALDRLASDVAAIVRRRAIPLG